MIADRKKFSIGAAMLAGFTVVLVLIFMPLFEGRNALNTMDTLYNSISKGSALFIPELRDKAADLNGKSISVTLFMENENDAAETARLFERSEAETERTGAGLKVSGDLGKIVTACLEDTTDMFENKGGKVRARYGIDEKKALYNWWCALKEMDKDLKRQEQFDEAKFIATVIKKGVECSYNYYGIEPENIVDKIPIVLFSLVFYVVYTIWYGFAIMFIFEGWGLKLSH